ncbi:MAG: nucleoside-diphosphate kinase [Eubacteriales bacterium]
MKKLLQVLSCGDFASSTGANVIHGSDSVENAKIEIKRFFNK